MKIQKFEGLVYDESTELLGVLAYVNHLKGEAVVITEEGETVTDLDNLTMLEKIMEINGEDIINHDIFSSDAEPNVDKLWEVELLDDGKLVLHLLDTKLNRIESGQPFEKSHLVELVPEFLQLEGNIHEFEPEEDKTVDFNITIVRQVVDGKLEYLYACNNKATEEVDLISVVFVGSTLLEEEDYNRVTVTHEEYLDFIEMGIITETSPQELQNYVTGLMYGRKTGDTEETVCGVNCGCVGYCEEEYADEDFNQDDEDEYDCDCDYCRNDADNDYCDECGDYHEDCKCN